MHFRLRSWSLFWALVLTASLPIVVALPAVDLRSARGMEPIILRSVRCALPLFLLAFTASSLATLWPRRGTRWLLSNRRYLGLAFAFTMGWHIAFVACSMALFGNPLNALITTLDALGLAFLLALTMTSFRRTARALGAANWRRLHKSGVYAIWLLATYIYLSAVRGDDRDWLHVSALGVLLLAWLLRAAAWLKVALGTRAVSAP